MQALSHTELTEVCLQQMELRILAKASRMRIPCTSVSVWSPRRSWDLGSLIWSVYESKGDGVVEEGEGEKGSFVRQQTNPRIDHSAFAKYVSPSVF